MKVVTFGECLFRFSSSKGERLSDAQKIDFYIGGSELNIAANLKSLGVEASWVSAIADGMTGDLIRERISRLGVAMDFCRSIPNGRAGWYLLETGAAPRPDVVFNRYASSLAEMKTFDFDWNKIFAGCELFHTSGIMAGLSKELTAEVQKSMQEAQKKKILVSYDFNYRKNIWSIDEFVDRQKDLLPLIDILFCAESDLELFFKKPSSSHDYSDIFNQTKLTYLVISQRSADESEYGIKVVTKDKAIESKKYKIQNLDRIGVGDSMAAGFMAGLLKTKDIELACQWGSLAGAIKYGLQGDMALIKEKELKDLLVSGPKGIIR